MSDSACWLCDEIQIKFFTFHEILFFDPNLWNLTTHTGWYLVKNGLENVNPMLFVRFVPNVYSPLTVSAFPRILGSVPPTTSIASLLDTTVLMAAEIQFDSFTWKITCDKQCNYEKLHCRLQHHTDDPSWVGSGYMRLPLWETNARVDNLTSRRASYGSSTQKVINCSETEKRTSYPSGDELAPLLASMSTAIFLKTPNFWRWLLTSWIDLMT